MTTEINACRATPGEEKPSIIPRYNSPIEEIVDQMIFEGLTFRHDDPPKKRIHPLFGIESAIRLEI